MVTLETETVSQATVTKGAAASAVALINRSKPNPWQINHSQHVARGLYVHAS